MGRGDHTEVQIIKKLSQVEAGRSVEELGRHYVTDQFESRTL